MIGRFSHQGVYHELLQSREFHRTALAGVLALASFLWDENRLAPTYVTPIMGAIVHNVGSVLVIVSSANLVFASDSQ